MLVILFVLCLKPNLFALAGRLSKGLDSGRVLVVVVVLDFNHLLFFAGLKFYVWLSVSLRRGAARSRLDLDLETYILFLRLRRGPLLRCPLWREFIYFIVAVYLLRDKATLWSVLEFCIHTLLLRWCSFTLINAFTTFPAILQFFITD